MSKKDELDGFIERWSCPHNMPASYVPLMKQELKNLIRAELEKDRQKRKS